MRLKSIKIENFRNYPSHTHEFASEDNLTVLVGPNGKGKTNFLEAIYVLSLGRSFRSLDRENLIEWEKDYARCQAEIETEINNSTLKSAPSATAAHKNEKTTLEFFCSIAPRKQRNFKKNGVNLRNSEFLGNLLTVLFQPEDLNMLYLSPSLRRRYMDIVLSQTDRNYLEALTNYKKTLKQRNALLKELRSTYREQSNQSLRGQSKQSALEQDLSAWDEKIAEFGRPIIEKRLELVAYLNKKITSTYNKISRSNDILDIEYQSRLIQNNQLKNYIEELVFRRQRDIFQTETTAGPHRDDLIFYLNGKEISKSASRGEIRTILLSIKLIEIEYIREKTGENPVLLLDDVLSELDKNRQKHLLEAVKNCQTIITATDDSQLKNLAHTSIVRS